MGLIDLRYSILTFKYKHQDLGVIDNRNFTIMENQQQILVNPSLSYYSGWLIALRNYDVFEIESIPQLINMHNENTSFNESGINNKSKYYLTMNFSHLVSK